MPPAAPTANYSAVQAAVSDFQVIFQKMQVVVQKNVGQTIPQLCHISPAGEQRAAGCCKNAAIQVHGKPLMDDMPQFSQAWGFNLTIF
jgi:hypothetical protein